MKNDKIKVLHVLSSFDSGGVEKVVLNYCKHMDLSKVSFGFTCYIGENGVLRNEFKSISDNLYRLPKKRYFFKTILVLRKILKKDRYDVIHIHLSFYSFIPLLASLFTKTKVRIVHYHLANKNISFFQKACNFANNLLATSIFYCGDLVYKINNFKEKREHYYMANAIDYKPFVYNEDYRASIRTKLHLSDDEMVIGTIGRMCEQKNPLFFVRFMKEMIKEKKNVKFLYVGDGELRDVIQDEIKKEEIEQYFILVGNKYNANEYYSAFDLFLVPSFFEGLSVSMLEAQINGLPVLASSSIDEQVNFSKHIIFCDLNDHISKWIYQANKLLGIRFEFDKEGYIKSGFDIYNSSNKLLDEYVKLLSRRRTK